MSNAAKVGLLVAVSLVVAGFFILRIENLNPGATSQRVYRLHIDNAQGLTEKAGVQLRGVRVGKVKRLTLTETGVEGQLLVDPDVPLHEGATASVISVGLLGDKRLELTIGDPGAPMLEENAIIPGDVSVSLDDVIGTMGAIGGDVKEITGSVRDVVASPEGKQNLEDFVQGLTRLTGQIDQTVADNRDEVRQLVSGIRDFSVSLGNVGKKIDRALGGESGENLGESVEGVHELIDRLRRTSAHLESVSQKIDEGKGTLGTLVNSQETGEQVGNTLESVQEAASFVTSTRFSAALSGDYLVARDRLKSRLSFEVRPPSPGYLRLEVVGTSLTADQPDSPTDEPDLAYTAMGGFRQGPVSVRAGVLESHPGLGADLGLLDGRLRLTTDAWDAGAAGPVPHTRLQAELYPLRWISLQVGWDDALHDATDSGFVGAGLRLVPDEE